MLQGNYVHNPSIKCLIAVGSNLESRALGVKETVGFALELLAAARNVSIIRRSRFYRTPAFPADSGPDFVNAAVEVKTVLSPEAMLALLHGIEARIGRERRERWAARVIDLDLLSHGELILPDRVVLDQWMRMPVEEQRRQVPDRLILPHPRLQDRAFVLVPLMDIAADWRHPATGLKVSEMLAALPPREVSEIVALTGPD